MCVSYIRSLTVIMFLASKFDPEIELEYYGIIKILAI